MTSTIGATSAASPPPAYTVGASAGSTTAPAASSPTQTLGQDDFLKLLVAELKYQDPSKPADGTAFLAQTAQFSTVEKLGSLTDLTTQLLAAQQVTGSAALVGRTVTYTDADGTDVSGVVTAVRKDSSGIALLVGSSATPVPLDQVKEVAATAPAGAGGTQPPAAG
jgi:flagellar basal-body rod modification protein FlgD